MVTKYAAYQIHRHAVAQAIADAELDGVRWDEIAPGIEQDVSAIVNGQLAGELEIRSKREG